MPNQVSRGELLESLRELADDLGRTPTQREVNEHGQYGSSTYYRHFGSYRDACREAGLSPNGKWHAKRRELLTSLE